KSGLVHTQFTADVRCGLTRFMLFDRRNDLALADSCLFHRSVVKVTNSRILTSPIFWEGYKSSKILIMRYVIGFVAAAFISTFTLMGSLFSKDGYSWTAIIIAYG